MFQSIQSERLLLGLNDVLQAPHAPETLTNLAVANPECYSGRAIESILADFDNAYAWGSAPGNEPNRPAGGNRGLRDLWAYWIDVYLSSIETNAAAWAGQAQTAMQGLSTAPNDEATNWVMSFFGPGGAGSLLQFAQPNPGSRVGRSGVAVPNSRYGMWTTASGPWT
jgi:hypothetical protein